jgi:hypothetical protein
MREISQPWLGSREKWREVQSWSMFFFIMEIQDFILEK